MRRAISYAVLFSASLFLSLPREAGAGVAVGVSVSFFHDALSPHGDWIQSERFGLVWAPRHVAHDWRPYFYGQWVYTDDDWTWVSDDDWGWATDHYGRWYFDPAAGWLWVPGDEWAPAWVAWRSGGGYVGWAPLPPGEDAFHVNVSLVIDPFSFSFVELGSLCEPHVYRRVVPVARNVTFVRLTENVTHYARVENRIVNRGVEIERVEHARGHAVPRVRLQEAASAAEIRGAEVRHGQVAVFRPRVAPSAPLRAPVRSAVVATPEEVARRQERERHDFQSAEERERNDLRKIHDREVKHPPAAHAAPSAAPAPRPHDTIDRDQLRAQHEAEVRAQAEHEQRERTALQKRQEREQQAAKERHPDAAPPKPHDGKDKKKQK
ncbi:MAG TPA: DUF6600 domain-containing protein [Vicinamibacteria bacterium]|nr:DUF6600 domain-containing protein [Vicinamibacteria bacterium]